ncbi:anoctamin-1 [Puma concolor]|uniref:Anoctamin n=1 Tax=Puma concolor TaxID=9696 RepID=A0A6P6H662_PUMCO|nr:anoctamin-1 [Puma concolor]
MRFKHSGQLSGGFNTSKTRRDMMRLPWFLRLRHHNTYAVNRKGKLLGGRNKRARPVTPLTDHFRVPLLPGTRVDGATRLPVGFPEEVDYILVYHPKRPSGSRTPARRVQHGDAAPAARGTRQDQPLPGKGDVGAAGGPEPPTDYHEDDKRSRREEYEGNLLEAGLELERDEETKIHGVGFVKIHAPWNVLCREAEFLKLKMPTKKLYHINETRGLLKKINSVLQKITDPIQPKVAGHRPQTTKRLSYPFSREKQHLFDLSDKDSFFDSKTRSTIVYEILKRTTCTKAKYSMGQTCVVATKVYARAFLFPPFEQGDYEGENVEFNDRKLLYQEWASYGVFYKYQPIDLVRKYFGEKIGLYFAWLGVYTQMLIPASVVGIIVFLYGCATVDENIPSMEMCDQRHNITMCPLCDKTCSYWKMSSACATARASHLFDNPATVFFSVFMALWAATFMEHWKRKQMRLNYRWDLTGFEEEEEAVKDHPRAEYEARVLEKSLRKESKSKEKRRHIPEESTNKWKQRVKTAMAGVKLTDKVKLTWRDRFPAYVTNLVSIVFMGTGFVGRPGDYVYIFRSFRMEEVTDPVFSSASPVVSPRQTRQKQMLSRRTPPERLWHTTPETGKKAPLQAQPQAISGSPARFETHQQEAAPGGSGDPTASGTSSPHGAHSQARLRPPSPLEPPSVIQFGFVTLFVASFPLAPLFALLNNIIEIRLDAKKFVTELRRPVAVRAKDIGIWYNILRGVGKLAVIINAFVISFTSDFIPRLVYLYMYSQNGTMHGFVNHTLSSFNVSDFQNGTAPNDPLDLGYEVQICRYKDYREPPWSEHKYDISKDFWAVLAARLAFVIVFQRDEKVSQGIGANAVRYWRENGKMRLTPVPEGITCLRVGKVRRLFIFCFRTSAKHKLNALSILLKLWNRFLSLDMKATSGDSIARTMRAPEHAAKHKLNALSILLKLWNRFLSLDMKATFGDNM